MASVRTCCAPNMSTCALGASDARARRAGVGAVAVATSSICVRTAPPSAASVAAKCTPNVASRVAAWGAPFIAAGASRATRPLRALGAGKRSVCDANTRPVWARIACARCACIDACTAASRFARRARSSVSVAPISVASSARTPLVEDVASVGARNVGRGSFSGHVYFATRSVAKLACSFVRAAESGFAKILPNAWRLRKGPWAGSICLRRGGRIRGSV